MTNKNDNLNILIWHPNVHRRLCLCSLKGHIIDKNAWQTKENEEFLYSWRERLEAD